MALESGSRLGSYEISNLLGKGGMGEVYRARDTKLGREVAIKVLPSEFSQDAEKLARLEREARMLAALNHPNIAVIHGLEESDDTRFLVLELVEGDTLADRLKGGVIPVEESLKLALQIAEALEAAHEKGVIHRDLKPANIKVTPDGKVKVLDFGLAKAYIGDAEDVNLSHSPTLSIQATQQGVILGTAGYMSPEQAQGQEVDHRTDIWAFGCVLLEILTGRRVFEGDNVSLTLARVLERDPDFSALPPNLNPKIRELIDRCLEKHPSNRWQAVGDVRLDIHRMLADPGSIYLQPSSEAGTVVRQSKLPWVAAVVLTAVVAGGIVWTLRPVPAPGPVGRFEIVLPEGQNFTMPPASMIAISPDGTRIAYAADSQIYLRNLNEAEARPVAGTDEDGVGAARPVFSPDGQWLAYIQVMAATGPFVLKRVPVTGGTPVQVFDASWPFGLTWPTQDAMVFANADGILRIPANGGTPEVLVERREDEALESPQILPGGEEVLFVSLPQELNSGLTRWDAAEISVQSIGGDDRTLIWSGGSDPRYLETGHLIYAQGSTLFALTYDPGTREVTGSPIDILQNVQRSSNGNTDAANYAISDNGSLVSIPATGAAATADGVLALMDRNGTTVQLDVRPGQYRGPRFSPDGERLAVEIIDEVGKSDIWVYTVSGDSEPQRLTQDGNNIRPIWTPDGERITFGSDQDGTWGIYEQPPDGSSLAVRLTTTEDNRSHFPEAWSPDGNTLSFIDANGPPVATTNWDLWTFSRDGSETQLIAGGPNNQFGSAWSPDGSWLAYANNFEVFGVYAQPYPPNGVIRQVTRDGEAWAIWSPNGELFFRLRLDTGGIPELRGIDVSTEGGITTRNPRTIPLQSALMYAGYRDFDFDLATDRFVIVVPASDGPTGEPVEVVSRIDVVLNWFQELRERVPVP